MMSPPRRLSTHPCDMTSREGTRGSRSSASRSFRRLRGPNPRPYPWRRSPSTRNPSPSRSSRATRGNWPPSSIRPSSRRTSPPGPSTPTSLSPPTPRPAPSGGGPRSRRAAGSASTSPAASFSSTSTASSRLLDRSVHTISQGFIQRHAV